ncbi:MAG: GNAT family N-acetyltransferase [Vicinamibacterales bacterium]
MTPALETARLLLRPLAVADAGQIQEIFPQWDVVRFLAATVPWPYPGDGALSFCRDHALPAIERGDEWVWTIRLKAHPEGVIGLIHLMRGSDNNRGFWIGPRLQRLGLMTEACDAVTTYWFKVLKFPLLRAPKAAANIASRRISEHQGMRLVATDERDYVSGRLATEVWEITADEWNARR